jgi:hypothetical protein
MYSHVSRTLLPRRRFLAATCSALTCSAAGLWSPGSAAMGEELPPVTDPRSTSGDDRFEPNWDKRLTVTVGCDDGDIRGTSQLALQAAVDYVARLGGGTVKILPGEYRLRNSVFLAPQVRLQGSGAETILRKEPSHSIRLVADSDWYDQEVTLEDAAGFQVGDGVCLKTTNPHNGSVDILKRTLVARSGNRFKLDRPLRKNYWLMGESTASSLFPMLTAEEFSDFVIEDLVLEGNRSENENLDGNYAGCIFLQDCNRVQIRGVTAQNYNGDGISWQICHDVVVENCVSQGNAGLGLHPGSGSQRPLMRNNTLAENDIGIFFCWGVKYGLAVDNRCRANRVGISIGHRDTDNRIAKNLVEESRDVGILFRPERGPTFCAHRNLVELNRVINSGGESGMAIDVQGGTEEVTFRHNTLRETRAPAQRTGIRLGADTKNIALVDNQIQGFAQDVVRA